MSSFSPLLDFLNKEVEPDEPPIKRTSTDWAQFLPKPQEPRTDTPGEQMLNAAMTFLKGELPVQQSVRQFLDPINQLIDKAANTPGSDMLMPMGGAIRAAGSSIKGLKTFELAEEDKELMLPILQDFLDQFPHVNPKLQYLGKLDTKEYPNALAQYLPGFDLVETRPYSALEKSGGARSTLTHEAAHALDATAGEKMLSKYGNKLYSYRHPEASLLGTSPIEDAVYAKHIVDQFLDTPQEVIEARLKSNLPLPPELNPKILKAIKADYEDIMYLVGLERQLSREMSESGLRYGIGRANFARPTEQFAVASEALLRPRTTGIRSRWMGGDKDYEKVLPTWKKLLDVLVDVGAKGYPK